MGSDLMTEIINRFGIKPTLLGSESVKTFENIKMPMQEIKQETEAVLSKVASEVLNQDVKVILNERG